MSKATTNKTKLNYPIVTAGPRDVIQYVNSTSVSVVRNSVQMGGFRFKGQYTKQDAPSFAMPVSKVVSTSTGLGAESAVRTENWYAVFACANSGGTVSLKLMPFLRAGTVSGSNVPLIKAGEGIHALTAQTYAWGAANNLAGVECLVISEGGGWSGRVTKIMANVAGQVTLETVGAVAAYDYLLPAPRGFEHYCYLGCFYVDTAEVRNIYDTGTLVKSKGIYILSPSTNGSQAVPGVSMNAAGYISPLALAVVLDSSCSLSTASSGEYAEYFDPDGGAHTVQSGYYYKTAATSTAVVFSNVQIPFLYPQKFWFANDGSLAATRINGQLNITGWIEP